LYSIEGTKCGETSSRNLAKFAGLLLILNRQQTLPFERVLMLIVFNKEKLVSKICPNNNTS
jgi:hypothetical protein